MTAPSPTARVAPPPPAHNLARTEATARARAETIDAEATSGAWPAESERRAACVREYERRDAAGREFGCGRAIDPLLHALLLTWRLLTGRAALLAGPGGMMDEFGVAILAGELPG